DFGERLERRRQWLRRLFGRPQDAWSDVLEQVTMRTNHTHVGIARAHAAMLFLPGQFEIQLLAVRTERAMGAIRRTLTVTTIPSIGGTRFINWVLHENNIKKERLTPTFLRTWLQCCQWARTNDGRAHYARQVVVRSLNDMTILRWAVAAQRASTILSFGQGLVNKNSRLSRCPLR